MSQNFDEMISNKIEELNGLKSEMEEIRLNFVAETASVIAKKFKPVVRGIIQDNVEQVQSLTDIELRQLKEKAEELTDNAYNIATEVLADSSLWWHLSENKEVDYSFYGNRMPDGIDKAVRYGVGKIAPILEEYKLLKTHASPSESYGVWREWDSSGNRKNFSGKPYFPGAFDWSEGMKNILKQYSKKHSEAGQILSEIKNLEIEKQKSNVLDRWDSI